MRVYLSGGMEYADGEGAKWRKDMQDWLENTLHDTVFNPNVESDKFFKTYYSNIDFRKLKSENIQLYREIASNLVALDCKEIAQNTDYVICYWDDGAMRGAGTKGELTMAKYFGKPVYMVTSSPHNEIPGWILGCVIKYFSSFDELKQFLKSSK